MNSTTVKQNEHNKNMWIFWYRQTNQMKNKQKQQRKNSMTTKVQTSYLPWAEWPTSPRWTCSRCFASLSFSSRDIITSFQSCSHQSIVADDCINNTSRNTYIIQKIVYTMVFTALHVMQTRYSDENSVRPSVCPSVRPSVRPSVCHTRVLWQNGRKICPDLYTIRKNI